MAEPAQDQDEIDQALEEMLAKYKKSTDPKSRFMMVDDVIPMLQAMRQEYIEGFQAQQDEIDDVVEAVASAEYIDNLETFVGNQAPEAITESAVFVDSLLKHFGCVDEKNEKTEKFPEAFKAAYDHLRATISTALTDATDLLTEEPDDEPDGADVDATAAQ